MFIKLFTERFCKKNTDALFLVADTLQEAKKAGLVKNFHQAESLYRQILQHEPDNVEALHSLGMLFFQTGHLESAVEYVSKAIEVSPKDSTLYFDLGFVSGRMDELDAAITHYRQAIALQPDYIEAYYNLGIVFERLDKIDEAITCYKQIISLSPGLVDAYNSLGLALEKQGYLDEALKNYHAAINLQENNFDAYANLARVYAAQNNFQVAIENLRQALAIDPDHADANNNLGCLLAEQGKFEQALSYFQRFTELSPHDVNGYFNLGKTLYLLGQLGAARDNLKKVLSIQPDYSLAESLLLYIQLKFCDWTTYAKSRQHIVDNIKLGASGYQPLAFLAISSSAVEQKQCVENRAKNFPVPSSLWTGECYSHNKIRIAYLSNDFRDHPVCFLMAGLFEQHNREQFEVFAISLKTEAHDYGQRIKGAFDQFIDVSGQTEYEIASLLRSLEIDIAIDLMGWTYGQKLGIFAYRPAPIQVNYLGYPGTIGADYIDYIIADSYLIPPESQLFYTEKIVYLPDCFQANDDRRLMSSHRPTRSEVGVPESAFVFCSFNDSYKFNPDFFDIWMRLLKTFPNSVLWLAANNEWAKKNLLDEAKMRNVNSDRLIFAERLPYPDHLARLHLADLFLDSLPFNAGATASDALWAGVPVLTCSGEAFASRMAGSLLHAIGLPELITNNLEEYEALALELASHPKKLAGIRARLASNKETYPLFNTRRFTRHIELAYMNMWQRYQRGESPVSFAVPSVF